MEIRGPDTSATVGHYAAGFRMPDLTRCRAVRKDGQPCGTTNNLSADGFCIWHDPARAAVAAAARARGQKTAQRAARGRQADYTEPMPDLITLEDCDLVASWVARQVAARALLPPEAREITAAIAQKRHVLGSIREFERRAREFKKRIAALEQQLKEGAA